MKISIDRPMVSRKANSSLGPQVKNDNFNKKNRKHKKQAEHYLDT
jgi:hypothetical protein